MTCSAINSTNSVIRDPMYCFFMKNVYKKKLCRLISSLFKQKLDLYKRNNPLLSQRSQKVENGKRVIKSCTLSCLGHCYYEEYNISSSRYKMYISQLFPEKLRCKAAVLFTLTDATCCQSSCWYCRVFHSWA